MAELSAAIGQRSVKPPKRPVASGRRAQHGELVGDLEPARPEAERLAPAGRPRAGLAALAGRLERAAPEQHALEVRRRDVVAERGRVEVAQLGDRERARARARSRRSCTRACRAAARGRRARSRRGRTRVARQLVDRVPARVGRDARDRRRAGRARGRRSRAPSARDAGRDRSSVSSCSRCASSRTSTFVARWRRIDSSSVSSAASVPPGSDQAPANGSSARSQSSTWSSPSRTWSTTASTACAGPGEPFRWVGNHGRLGPRLSTLRRKLA